MISGEEMRVRLGLDASDETQDALIFALMADAAEFARAYCHLAPGEEIPDFLLARMTEEDYGRLEGAGLTARTVAGAAEHYRGAYSDDVLALLRALRHPGGREAAR